MDRLTTPGGVGGDTAEDVFGGLDAVLKLSWPTDGTKVDLLCTSRPSFRIFVKGGGGAIARIVELRGGMGVA